MALTITIGGNPVCVHAPGGTMRLSVQESVTSRATAQLTIQDPTGLDYAAAQPGGFNFNEIIIQDGIDTVFAGLVTNQRNTTEPGLQDIHYIDVRAVDWTILLDRRRVFGIWEKGEAVTTIIETMLDYTGPGGTDSATTDGVTRANVDGGLVLAARLIIDGLSISEAIAKIASDTGVFWWIDWLKDIHMSATPDVAPFDIDDTLGACNFASIASEQATDRYSNTRWVRRSFDSVPDRVVVFVGDDVTQVFFVDQPLAQAPVLIRRTATYAETTITLTGLPADGDTITIDGTVYTFRTGALTTNGEVKVGATAAATTRNLSYAINKQSTYDGDSYFATTALHPSCEAIYETGALIWIRVREISTGDGTAISKSSAAITLGAATLTGAQPGNADPGTTTPSVGELGVLLPETADWEWKAGSTAINQAAAAILADGEYLEVRYKALFSNWENSYDLTGVTANGRWESAGDEDEASDGKTSKSVADAWVRKYGEMFSKFEYRMHAEKQPLVTTLRAGMSQVITAPSVGINADSDALITDISRTWRYTVLADVGDWRCTNVITGIVSDEPLESWLEFFKPDSGGIGGSSSGGGGGLSSGSQNFDFERNYAPAGVPAVGDNLAQWWSVGCLSSEKISLAEAYANCQVAPSSGDFEMDWKVCLAADDPTVGGNWNSIFTTTKCIIANGDLNGVQTDLVITELFRGDLIRVDVITNGLAEVVSMYLRGRTVRA